MTIVEHRERFIRVIKSFTQSSPWADWRHGIWDRVSNGTFGHWANHSINWIREAVMRKCLFEFGADGVPELIRFISPYPFLLSLKLIPN